LQVIVVNCAKSWLDPAVWADALSQGLRTRFRLEALNDQNSNQDYRRRKQKQKSDHGSDSENDAKLDQRQILAIMTRQTKSPENLQQNARTFDGEYTMTDDLERQVRQALRRRKRFPVVLISVVLLAVIAAAGAYIWFNYHDLIREFSVAAHPGATPVVDGGEETVTLRNFQSLERQTHDSLESTAQDIAAQKAELKRLSDQIAALSARIDAMQSAPQPTGSLEPRPGSQEPATSPRASVVGTRKKLPAPKTSGPLSVGGAPLPLAPPANQ
jgi:uncharacterized coiled-coil protein SlyX